MAENVRAHVIISGKVQGVFFRADTREAANRFGVNGWVRNQRDGTVEAVFEGDQSHVESVLNWCKKGSPAARVDAVNVKWESYTGDFSDFHIRY
jgi:acylphosphatase